MELKCLNELRLYLVNGVRFDKNDFIELKDQKRAIDGFKEINELVYRIQYIEPIINYDDEGGVHYDPGYVEYNFRDTIATRLDNLLNNLKDEITQYVHDIKHSQDLLLIFFTDLNAYYQTQILSVDQKPIMSYDFVQEKLADIAKYFNSLKQKYQVSKPVLKKTNSIELRHGVITRHLNSIVATIFDEDIILDGDKASLLDILSLNNESKVTVNFNCSRPVFAGIMDTLREKIFKNSYQKNFLTDIPYFRLRGDIPNADTIAQGKKAKDPKHQDYINIKTLISLELDI